VEHRECLELASTVSMLILEKTRLELASTVSMLILEKTRLRFGFCAGGHPIVVCLGYGLCTRSLLVDHRERWSIGSVES